MLSERDNFLETLKIDGKPERMVNSFAPFTVIENDPVFRYLRGNRVRGTNSYDRFGTYIAFPEDQPAAVPIVTKENQVIKDIENWREYLKIPDLRGNCSEGWEDCILQKEKAEAAGLLSLSILGTGIFEQLHMLMTFEDCLCAFLLYPDEMHELIEAIYGFRMEYMRLIVEKLHPDAIVSHDDFGSKDRLFMSPEIWREFFKEPYKRLYDYLHENGVIIIHHSDSYIEPIAEDIADTGADILQGLVPTNDIVSIHNRLNGRMILMGGVDSIIDRADVSRDEIHREIERVFTEYDSLRYFIPGISYGGPGSIFPDVLTAVSEEIAFFNERKAGK